MLEVQSLRLGYATICKHVLRTGDTVSPRGQRTKEVREMVIKVLDPADSLPIVRGRDLKEAIGAAEALQLVGGFSDPQLMFRITKTFGRFMDGGVLHGAYGPRIKNQVPAVIRRLRSDPDTRQAVLQIWRPEDDLFGEARDLPCTLGFQFFIRNGKLEMSTTMRSNDVWLGLAYDIFQFAQLQLSIAKCLNLQAGPLYHHARSFHAYERDWEKIDSLNIALPIRHKLHGIGEHGMEWRDIVSRAHSIYEGFDGHNQTEQWYADTLGRYLERSDS